MPTREEMIEAITQKMWTWNFWAWHLMSIEPVRIWDVLEYALSQHNVEMSFTWKEEVLKIVFEWDFLRLPIEKQSDDCIKFVFDLLPKN
jgi:hypothetical protein